MPLPPHSFLRRPVHSAQELNRQLETDGFLTTRYGRCLNMSPAMVRMAFAELKLVPLKEDRVMRVYGVVVTDRGERYGYKRRRVKKGTPVYALQDGTPVLLQICGNLVVKETDFRSSPDVTLHNTPTFNPYELEAAQPVPPEEVTAGGVPKANAASPTGLPGDFVEVAVPDSPPPTPLEPPKLLAVRAKQKLLAWLFPPILVPFFVQGGGGSRSFPPGFPPVGPIGSGIDVPPAFGVPETGSAILLTSAGAGMLFLLGRRLRRSRR